MKASEAGRCVRVALAAGILLVATIGSANAQIERFDAAMARTSGLVAIPLVRAKQPRGIRMLVKAAQRGDRLAQYNLGVAYARGHVTGEPAPQQALAWYQRAAARRYAAAAYNIGALYTTAALGRADLERAAAWMRQAADWHHADARRWLADHARLR